MAANMMSDELEFLARLRSAYDHLVIGGHASEARAVMDCIETFIVAWKAGNVTCTVDGRYMWGVPMAPTSRGV